jgi:hypothetical protein
MQRDVGNRGQTGRLANEARTGAFDRNRTWWAIVAERPVAKWLIYSGMAPGPTFMLYSCMLCFLPRSRIKMRLGRLTREFVLLLVSALLLILAGIPPAHADKRVALVIGNSAYRNVARLDNPANDAELTAETLRALGFTLVGGGAQLDLDKASLDRSVQAFGAQLAGADVGLFYYAGHGVQVRGENYLIPVDANPTKEADVDFQMLDTSLVLRQMEGAGTRLNIVILDACRNNPFGGRGLAVGRAEDAGTIRLRDTSAGLAQMQAPEGTLISFATQPGSVAQDGVAGNSPYALALAREMRRPGLDIFQTFNQVGLTVKRATGGLQLPWVSTSPIDGVFYFVEPSNAGVRPDAAVTAAPPLPPADAQRFEGVWVGKLVCEATPPQLPGWKYDVIGMVTNGVFHSRHGTEGKPGSETFDGTIKPDGAAEISQVGLSGESKSDPLHRPAGTQFRDTYVGKFETTRAIFTRLDRASCNIEFIKQDQNRVTTTPSATVPQQSQTRVDLSTSPSTSDDTRRFDGKWLGTISCKATPDRVAAYEYQFLAEIKDGAFHGVHGVSGQAGFASFGGTIKPDGAGEITATGLTGPDAPGHPPPGTPYSYPITAKFERSSGKGIRLGGRICSFVFAKQ